MSGIGIFILLRFMMVQVQARTRQAWLCLFFFCFLSEQETSFCVKLKQLDSKLADQADKAVGIAEKSRADQFPAWK
jgi:hypothetical protein